MLYPTFYTNEDIQSLPVNTIGKVQLESGDVNFNYSREIIMKKIIKMPSLSIILLTVVVQPKQKQLRKTPYEKGNERI